MSPSNLIEKCKEIGTYFLKIPHDQFIRIYCHQDSDGICAASILAKALQKKHYKFQLHSIYFLTPSLVQDLVTNNRSNDIMVFIDIGSSYLSLLKEHCPPNQQIIVIDHHIVDDIDAIPDNLIHLNSYDFGVDGSTEACASSLAFFIAQAIDSSPKTDCFAILGILGDYQNVGRQYGLIGLNKEVISFLKKNKTISETMDLWFAGGQNRTVIQILETLKLGDENNNSLRLVSRVLKETEISPYIQFDTLNKEEKRRIASKLAEFHVGIDAFVRHVFTFEKESNPVLKEVMSLTETLEGLIQANNIGTAFSIALGDRKKALVELEAFKLSFTQNIAEAIDWANEFVEKKQAMFYLDVGTKFNLATIQSSANILLDKCEVPLISSIDYTNDYSLILVLIPSNLQRVGMKALEELKKAHDATSINLYDLTGANEIARTVIPKNKLKNFLEALDKQVYRFIREPKGS
ncbi:MAG: DHH family phosphoesterase [Candidatus Hermodarchaeota archaeon]